jgi:hypothetical protein
MDGGNQILSTAYSFPKKLALCPIVAAFRIGLACALVVTMFSQRLWGQTDELAFVSDRAAFLEDGEAEHGLSQPNNVQWQTWPQTGPSTGTHRARVLVREDRLAPATTPIAKKWLPAPKRESAVRGQPTPIPQSLAPAQSSDVQSFLTRPEVSGAIPRQRLASFRPLPPAGPQRFFGPTSPPSLRQLDEDVLWVHQDGAVESNGPPASPAERYGEEPVDRSLQFLRGQAVLLSECQWQFDYGLTYSLDSFHVPALEGTNIVRADVERRQFYMPLGVRYGWDDRTQIFANLPVGLAHTEFGTPFTDLNTNTFDLGDLNVGLSRLIQQGSYSCPDIIFTVDASVPLGDSTVPPDLTSADMSIGVWSAATSLLLVHQYDPMVVYWGGGFRYNFEATHGGISYDAGHEINYQVGTGFAVNDRMTLGAAVIGAFITEAEINDVGIGGIRDSLRGRLSLTVWRNGRIVEPFAEWGMTDVTPDARLGVVWTR